MVSPCLQSDSWRVAIEPSVGAAGKAAPCVTGTLPRAYLARSACRAGSAVARRDIVSVVADFSSGAAIRASLNARSDRLSPPPTDSQRPIPADSLRHAIARRWHWRCAHRRGTEISSRGIYTRVARRVDVSARVARSVDTRVDRRGGDGCAAATAGRSVGAEHEKQVFRTRSDATHVVPKGSQRACRPPYGKSYQEFATTWWSKTMRPARCDQPTATMPAFAYVQVDPTMRCLELLPGGVGDSPQKLPSTPSTTAP
jgi:hypothetical protein